MKSLLICMVAIGAAHPASATRAQDTSDEGHVLSVGAGLGFGQFTGGGLSSLLYLGGYAGGLGISTSPSAPTATGLVEFAHTDHLRWVLGISGSYEETRFDDGDPATPHIDSQVSDYGGTFGFRWVISPTAPVQVAPMVTLGLAKARAEGVVTGSSTSAEGVRTYYLTDASVHRLSARVGLVLEYELLKHLFLRFENSILSASITKSERTETREPDEPKQEDSTDGTRLGFRWVPALQLRLVL